MARGRGALVFVVVWLSTVLAGTAGAAPGDQADLAITAMTVPSDTAYPTQSLIYTEIANAGPATAETVTLTYTLPPGVTAVGAYVGSAACATPVAATVTPVTMVCSSGAALAAGEHLVAALRVANSALAAGASLVIAAAVSHDGADPDLANNAATIGVSFSEAPPRLVADVRLGEASVAPAPESSAVARLALVITNDGPDTADGVSVTFTVPAGLRVLTAHIATRDCEAPVGDTLTCPLRTPLPAGATTATGLIVANTGLPAGSTALVGSHIDTTAVDADLADNDRVIPVTFAGGPVPDADGQDRADLLLVPTGARLDADPPNAAFSWSLFSLGPSIAQAVTVTFRIGPGLSPVFATIALASDACPFDPATRTVVCTLLRPLTPGVGNVVALVGSTAGAPPGATIEVEAIAAAVPTDPEPADNRSTQRLVLPTRPAPAIDTNEGAATAAPTPLPATGRPLDAEVAGAGALLGLGLLVLGAARWLRRLPATA